MKETIEHKVAETILQRPKTIKVGGRTYSVAPPSIATLILASEAISQLPSVALDDRRVVEESLRIAKDCKAMGDVAAILLLGAEESQRPIKRKKRILRLFSRRDKELLTRKDEVAYELLNRLDSAAFNALLLELLRIFSLGDFFGLTTFLTGINLLRPTKVD